MLLLRPLIIFFLSFILISNNSYSNCVPYTKEFFVDVWTGYRSDDLKWNVKDNTLDPSLNTLINWKDVQSWQVGLYQRLVTCNNIYFRSSADYGWVFDGNATHNALQGDTVEFIATYDSKHGDVFDVSGGIGYQFNFLCDTFRIAPLVGFSYSSQEFHLDNGLRQGVFVLPGLLPSGSKYQSRWYGPWVGADLQYDFTANFNMISELEYHWGRMHSDGNFALINIDPPGFEDKSAARGYSATLAANYIFCDWWTIGVKGKFEYFKTSHNATDTRLLSGPPTTVATLPLNYVKWQEWSISILVGRYF